VFEVSEHKTHTTTVLVLSEVRPDGSAVSQSWHVCSCIAAQVREQLGPARLEMMSTPEGAQQIISAVTGAPGAPGTTVMERGPAC
jgi:hypothetical protein